MNVLAIGAHPDDIEFGCGGSLIKYARAGHAVWLFILTDGRYGGNPEVRRREQEKAARFIGAQGVYWGRYVDTELAEVGDRELIKKMDEVIHKVEPDVVFLNFPEDVHQDHRATAQAAVSATRYVKEVLFYEVPTTQHFEPDVFVDIKSVIRKKQQLLRLHASQVDKTRVQNLTIVESVQSCANFRGFQGRVRYAEGFKALRLLREIG